MATKLDYNGAFVIDNLNEFGEIYSSAMYGEQGYTAIYSVSVSTPQEYPKTVSGTANVIGLLGRQINKVLIA